MTSLPGKPTQTQDPLVPDWANLALSDAWPDTLNLSAWCGWREMMRAFTGKKRRAVELPEAIRQLSRVPKYALQEFHNLPNGNYSRRFSRGYITGFDLVMLGQMQHTRQWMAEQLKDCCAVLDVGTGGGRTAAAIKGAGATRVWGLDPSPYLLQHAAQDFPDIEFIPGVAEDLPFADQRLDAIALCFVLHEIPPKYIRQAFAEFYRVLRPGGKIVIAEPSAQQLTPLRWYRLTSRKGWRHLYFKILATRAYEPFLQAWHKLDKHQLLLETGFGLVEERSGLPVNTWVIQKPAAP